MANYDLGVIRADDREIICANYKINAKQSSEKIEVTNSYDSVGWKHGKRSYTIDCGEVFLDQMPFIRDLFLTKKEFTLSTFNIMDDGSYKEGMVLLGCIVTEFDDEMDEGGKASFKAEALSLQE